MCALGHKVCPLWGISISGQRLIFLLCCLCCWNLPPNPLGDPVETRTCEVRLPSVISQVRVPAGSPSGLAWSLYKCSALWRAVYGLSATERPLGTIREEKGISSWFRVSISSRYDLSSWKRRKTQFLPSFQYP